MYKKAAYIPLELSERKICYALTLVTLALHSRVVQCEAYSTLNQTNSTLILATGGNLMGKVEPKIVMKIMMLHQPACVYN